MKIRALYTNQTRREGKSCAGCRVGNNRFVRTISRCMKQPTNQRERNEDKKKPEKENPSHGIVPESKEPEMEVDHDPGEWQKESQNQKKHDPLAA